MAVAWRSSTQSLDQRGFPGPSSASARASFGPDFVVSSSSLHGSAATVSAAIEGASRAELESARQELKDYITACEGKGKARVGGKGGKGGKGGRGTGMEPAENGPRFPTADVEAASVVVDAALRERVSFPVEVRCVTLKPDQP